MRQLNRLSRSQGMLYEIEDLTEVENEVYGGYEDERGKVLAKQDNSSAQIYGGAFSDVG